MRIYNAKGEKKSFSRYIISYALRLCKFESSIARSSIVGSCMLSDVARSLTRAEGVILWDISTSPTDVIAGEEKKISYVEQDKTKCWQFDRVRFSLRKG